jgi:prolyl oligopeptidase
MDLVKSAALVCLVFLCCCQSLTQRNPAAVTEIRSSDPYLWLENNSDKNVADWVKKHDQKTLNKLTVDPRYDSLTSDIKSTFASKDRIPWPTIRDGSIRNFWEDQSHSRGVWRQTTFSSYKQEIPNWETLIDINQLNKEEGKSWVWAGSDCLAPKFNLCLIKLSDGGKDSHIVREFDVSKKAFVANGFTLPEAKSSVSWINKNTLFIATEMGPGTLNQSGYPRQVRIWTRGTPASESRLIFEGQDKDVSVSADKNFRPDSQNMFVTRGISYYEQEVFQYQSNGTLVKLPFPASSQYLGDFKGLVFCLLRKDWPLSHQTFKAGSVVALPLKNISTQSFENDIETVFKPDEKSFFSTFETTKNRVYLQILRNVKGEIYQASRKSGEWTLNKIPLNGIGTADLTGTTNFDDRFFVTFESFNSPTKLYLFDPEASLKLTEIKTLPPKFDGGAVIVKQFEVKSLDGTIIPYFVVYPRGMVFDGNNPTILYGYGGFEISLKPSYLGVIGKIWLEKKGVYVLSNIRGGGEFGPRWHDAVLKENRHLAFEDFNAITQDLFTRKITSPKKLGIWGASNGGLLMGVAMTQHPENYKAVVAESALLDMIRYPQMPPGADWIDEYGDPEDPKMGKVILKYSPYQNVHSNRSYPTSFFYTSTADDRVHPGHSRKMVARLEEVAAPVLLYENTEGGHGGAAGIQEQIKKIALEFIFFYQQLLEF